MEKMEIQINNLNWLENSKPKDDLCLHGNITVKIDGKDIINPENNYTLSTTGLYFLRTLKLDYTKDQEWGNYFFPCCGFLFCSFEKQEYLVQNILTYTIGCPNGKDIYVMHKEKYIEVSFETISEKIEKNDYIKMVTNFTDAIELEYKKSKKKLPKDKLEKIAYNQFWEEWNARKNEIIHLTTAST